MFPATFDYHRPTSLDEALKLLADGDGDVKVLAGGHSLLPLMKLRLTQPRAVVDISRIDGLKGITIGDDSVSIGALTTHATIEGSDELKQRLPILPECAALIGDLQVRNRGTLGGSLAHADPASDFPAVILALDADMLMRGPQGERTVKAVDFFIDMLTSAVGPNEILTSVRIPIPSGKSAGAYLKMDHPASHYALCGVAAVLGVHGGMISDAHVAITGVAPKPYRASGVESALAGQPATAGSFAQAAVLAADGQEMLGDLHASGDYRAHLARVYTRRALEKAASRL
ncbi:MAG: xanthine dehydrogenase family protein subunit M [Chloroflexi bacterium]|nr:xanthine dehydrogenase family protein subunit M [Chloroflexota bacterium]